MSAQSFVLSALDVIPDAAGALDDVDVLQNIASHVDDMPRGDYNPTFRNAVLAKWRSPAISGVLRPLLSVQPRAAGYEHRLADLRVRQHPDIEKIGLQVCALPSCETVEHTVRDFKQCSGCRSVFYCCAEHATLDWGERHRKDCAELKAARKKAAAEAATPAVGESPTQGGAAA